MIIQDTASRYAIYVLSLLRIVVAFDALIGRKASPHGRWSPVPSRAGER